MPSIFSTVTWIALASSQLLSCRHVSQTLNSSSELKHEYGETSRGAVPLENCKTRRPPVEENVDGSPKVSSIDYTLAEAYVSKILRYIMAKNNNIFKGRLDFSHFCVSVVRDDEFNAFALAESGNVIVNDTLLKAMSSDALFAATLAHELAHVTMGHTIDAVHPLLANNSEYDNQLSKMDKFLETSSLEKNRKAISDSLALKMQNPKYASFAEETDAKITLISSENMKLFKEQRLTSSDPSELISLHDSLIALF
ncbi:MAG: hypothetical protein EOP07_13275 [Proteobacteria bacterium]|nr:MAG: hypothetical protein EOP07_13275 [Pseudomonadota bacterium]